MTDNTDPQPAGFPEEIAYYCGRDGFLRAINTGSFYAFDMRCGIDGLLDYGTARLREVITELRIMLPTSAYQSVLDAAGAIPSVLDNLSASPYFVTSFAAALDSAFLWGELPGDSCALVLRVGELLGDGTSLPHGFFRVQYDAELQHSLLRGSIAQGGIRALEAAEKDPSRRQDIFGEAQDSLLGPVLLTMIAIGNPARRPAQECRMFVRCDSWVEPFVIRTEPHRHPTLPISLRNHETLAGLLPLAWVILGPRSTQGFGSWIRDVLRHEYGNVEVRSA